MFSLAKNKQQKISKEGQENFHDLGTNKLTNSLNILVS